jgi:hypothetical protein
VCQIASRQQPCRLTLGLPPSPMHSALTSELLPVPAAIKDWSVSDSITVMDPFMLEYWHRVGSAPFGPSTRFRRGPGSMIAS